MVKEEEIDRLIGFVNEQIEKSGRWEVWTQLLVQLEVAKLEAELQERYGFGEIEVHFMVVRGRREKG